MALCRAMSTRIAWLRLISALGLLLQDAVRFLLLGARTSAALKAENLFLRKQLAPYLERKAKLRRADDACPYRKSDADVLMMQASKKRRGGDLRDTANGSSDRCVLVQGEVSAHLIIIGDA